MDHPEQNPGYASADYLTGLEARMLPLKELTYALMQIQSGDRVVDVGCGPGIDTERLATLVGPTGRVIGFDYDASMVARADERARRAGITEWVEHHYADATQLPLATNSVECCRSERVFQHLAAPEQVFDEMVRVTKPGGHIVVADADHSTMLSITNGHPEIERVLRNAYVDAHRFPNAGRALPGIFRSRELNDLKVEILPLFTTSYEEAKTLFLLSAIEARCLEMGLVTDGDLSIWRSGLAALAAQGRFFCSANVIVVAAAKP